MSDIRSRVLNEFAARCGGAPDALVRAPGRVNLIGEHTDYNEGFVMPIAIERATWIALRARSDTMVILHSLDHQATLQFDADRPEHGGEAWTEYPKGVANALREEGFVLRGFEGVTACDVPMGAGLSSSASYELAVARAFQVVSGWAWDPIRMALLAQRAENRWVGVQCGIMDQLISAIGKRGHALLIDCRDLSHRAAPLPEGCAVVIMDTMTRRGLVDSAYNERRAQCQAAARQLGVRALRDVTEAEWAARAHELEETVRKRARHVVTENARTLAAAEAMSAGDGRRLGRLMNESHDSLRDDFQVTNDALNLIVDLARAHPACLGARMTGAGFGGCAVALVSESGVDDFCARLRAEYSARTGKSPSLYVTRGADGAATD
ncbi:MAG: galactokinase [Kiritimatiellae bacterium]|nr:galactokinase [Kiritimatiellia bacterium]MDW8457957.1 galactokinase [Verrucomicrobiota bacterium]